MRRTFRSVRRQLFWLRVYVTVSSLALVIVATAAFRQAAPAPQNLGEITVERINVVDRNGTLRMVISNKDRQHPGVLDGVTADRPRPEAGLLFFNDKGDEVGGLLYHGRAQNGGHSAGASFTFDQWRQDQTIALRYGEVNNQRSAALEMWDRSEQPVSEFLTRFNAAMKIADPQQREAALNAAQATAPPAFQRVYLGKTPDQATSLSLADARGKPRLTLTVDATGNPRIEFLDQNGKVTKRVP
ncbi:MAG: hypothetical protein LAO77_26240 [Acidobacteriia bacterium]|nr:hypothetical protein [Terriglobia bacterium]